MTKGTSTDWKDLKLKPLHITQHGISTTRKGTKVTKRKGRDFWGKRWTAEDDSILLNPGWFTNRARKYGATINNVQRTAYSVRSRLSRLRRKEQDPLKAFNMGKLRATGYGKAAIIDDPQPINTNGGRKDIGTWTAFTAEPTIPAEAWANSKPRTSDDVLASALLEAKKRVAKLVELEVVTKRKAALEKELGL